MVFLCTLTVLNLRETSTRLGSLSRSVAVRGAYNSMLVHTAAGVSHLDALVHGGSAEHKTALQRSIEGALLAAAEVRQYGNEDDRALLTALEERYGQQLALAQNVLEEGEDPQETANEIDPFLFTDLATALSTPTVQTRQEFRSQLDSLKTASNTRITVLLVGSTASLPLLAFLFFILLRYEQKYTVQVLELEALSEAALTDSLTGLGNHRAFQDDLKRELARASRLELPLSIAMMDIDDFKVIKTRTTMFTPTRCLRISAT
jgi:GGDEF domain-containing protein